MLRFDLTRIVQASVDRLVASGRLPSGLPRVEMQDTKDPAHGDFATNFAMVASKPAGMNPRALAEIVKAELEGSKETLDPTSLDPLDSVEIAGPGFINLRLNPEYVASYVPAILSLDPAQFAARAAEATAVKHRINVEFVSVNPNGPITVGSGRGAAFGSTLASVLEAAGHNVHREYYINDGVNSEQMRLFAESVRAYCRGEVPETGYRGEFPQRCAQILLDNPDHDLQDVEIQLHSRLQKAISHNLDAHLRTNLESQLILVRQIRATNQATSDISQIPLETMIRFVTHVAVHSQREDLRCFGVEYASWREGIDPGQTGWQYESRLHDLGVVEAEINALVAKGAADDRPIRHKLKLAKGGVVEDVEIEEQASEEDPENPLTSQGRGSDSHEFGVRVDSQDEPHDRTEGHPSPPSPLSPGRGEGEKTLWLRSTKFGDDMDRVIRRKDGRLTYIASDVAYHKDKFNRPANADKLITVLGPDHHGYIGRLHAVLAAVELSEGSPEPPTTNRQPLTEVEAKLYSSPEERDACQTALAKARKELDVVIFQLVRFMKDGKPAPMRKRDGNIYALIDLIDEIGKKVKPEAPLEEQRKSGKDVARFFYLMRSHDTTFDFDLDLAEKQSDENPVFYVQYAHARICSVLRKAEASRLQSATANCQLLTHTKESALIKKILDLPYEVHRCAEDYGVHRLTTYAIELARAFHHFYDACRVIQPDQPELSQARLALCEATKTALRATLDLLGVEAPESM